MNEIEQTQLNLIETLQPNIPGFDPRRFPVNIYIYSSYKNQIFNRIIWLKCTLGESMYDDTRTRTRRKSVC